ncbi:hypothetical protein RF11_09938 [Thelohanellus kitauei]|uniref:Uncharacterized protein n=1 Tax=Thelohanellus kitauei TaxID=669202 RepID=A0A0C2MYN1_THEKT|nr:hypothetical protein RF11_09938 [Thelohanellus kitauei]
MGSEEPLDMDVIFAEEGLYEDDAFESNSLRGRNIKREAIYAYYLKLKEDVQKDDYLSNWKRLIGYFENCLNYYYHQLCQYKDITAIYGMAYAEYFQIAFVMRLFNLIVGILVVIFMILPQIILDVRKNEDSVEAASKNAHDSNYSKSTKYALLIWKKFLKYMTYYSNYDGANFNKYYKKSFYNTISCYVFLSDFIQTVAWCVIYMRITCVSVHKWMMTLSPKIFSVLLKGYDVSLSNVKSIMSQKERVSEDLKNIIRHKSVRLTKIHIFMRSISWICIVTILLIFFYFSLKVEQNRLRDGRQNLIFSVYLSLLSYVFWRIFEIISTFEGYDPAVTARIVLIRCSILKFIPFVMIYFREFKDLGNTCSQYLIGKILYQMFLTEFCSNLFFTVISHLLIRLVAYIIKSQYRPYVCILEESLSLVYSQTLIL